MKSWYDIKIKLNKTIVAGPRYKHKRYLKGKTYHIRRKANPHIIGVWRKSQLTSGKILYARKIKRSHSRRHK